MKKQTRLFLHVNDAAKNGHRRILIVANDTDVVVIALYAYFSLEINKLWVEYSTGNNRCWLPIQQYASIIGKEKCRAYTLLVCINRLQYRFISFLDVERRRTIWDPDTEATECFVRYVFVKVHSIFLQLKIYSSLGNIITLKDLIKEQ